MSKGKIILASGSPRRAKVLRDAGVEFEVRTADVQEISIDSDPVRTVQYNAEVKAQAVASLSQNDELIIAADTVVYAHEGDKGQVLGKPVDMDDAKDMLRRLSGRDHGVSTGVCVIRGRKKIAFVDESLIRFKKLDEALIDEYHSLVNPLDKAGAYNIDEHGDMLVEKLGGSHESVMGLPIGVLAFWLDSEFDIKITV